MRSVEAVALDHPARDADDLGALDGVDLPGAGLGREDAEDAGAGAHVEHDIAWLDHLGDRPPVPLVADRVAQHPAMDRELTVGVVHDSLESRRVIARYRHGLGLPLAARSLSVSFVSTSATCAPSLVRISPSARRASGTDIAPFASSMQMRHMPRSYRVGGEKQRRRHAVGLVVASGLV